MSGGSSDPLRALICGGSPGKFALPAEGWQACSNHDILAAAKQLGVLQQRREWRDNVGQARAQWQELRLKLQQVYAGRRGGHLVEEEESREETGLNE